MLILHTTFHTKDLPAKFPCLRRFFIVSSLDEKVIVGLSPTKKLKLGICCLIQVIFISDPREYPRDTRNWIQVRKRQDLSKQLPGDLGGGKHRRAPGQDALSLGYRVVVSRSLFELLPQLFALAVAEGHQVFDIARIN